ncbi:MAG: hypothetical protein IPN01_29815 [Deltaproteobacteria bacterium]|nr:hypothetical protein [Deltaproteobacteria bacterium]
MRRAPDGRLVPSILDGARPYAGVRVDLVDPSTGRAGQVGDQPMVVAVAGLEPRPAPSCCSTPESAL